MINNINLKNTMDNLLSLETKAFPSTSVDLEREGM